MHDSFVLARLSLLQICDAEKGRNQGLFVESSSVHHVCNLDLIFAKAIHLNLCLVLECNKILSDCVEKTCVDQLIFVGIFLEIVEICWCSQTVEIV